MADLTAAPCRSKLWIGRPRCRASATHHGSWWRPTMGSQGSFVGSGHAPLGRSAVGHRANETSIASEREERLDPDARRLRAQGGLWVEEREGIHVPAK